MLYKLHGASLFCLQRTARLLRKQLWLMSLMCLYNNNRHEIDGLSIPYFSVDLFFNKFYSSKNTIKIVDKMFKNNFRLHYSLEWLSYAANEDITKLFSKFIILCIYIGKLSWVYIIVFGYYREYWIAILSLQPLVSMFNKMVLN